MKMEANTKVIDRFDGEYSFLSNFYLCRVTFYGMTFPSVEAAFQAAKCADPADREQFLKLTPAQAKQRGRQVKMRSDWEERKLTVMHNLLVHKFVENPELVSKLIATGTTVLVEGNNWHDNFWGNCTCPKCRDKKGQNNLGGLLMRLRAEYIARAASTPGRW